MESASPQRGFARGYVATGARGLIGSFAAGSPVERRPLFTRSRISLPTLKKARRLA